MIKNTSCNLFEYFTLPCLNKWLWWLTSWNKNKKNIQKNTSVHKDCTYILIHMWINMYHFSGMTYCKSAAESMTLWLPNRSINSDYGGHCQFFQCPAWWLSHCRSLSASPYLLALARVQPPGTAQTRDTVTAACQKAGHTWANLLFHSKCGGSLISEATSTDTRGSIFVAMWALIRDRLIF